MTPYMRAYEAGVKLAQSEYFGKYANPAEFTEEAYAKGVQSIPDSYASSKGGLTPEGENMLADLKDRYMASKEYDFTSDPEFIEAGNTNTDIELDPIYFDMPAPAQEMEFEPMRITPRRQAQPQPSSPAIQEMEFEPMTITPSRQAQPQPSSRAARPQAQPSSDVSSMLANLRAARQQPGQAARPQAPRFMPGLNTISAPQVGYRAPGGGSLGGMVTGTKVQTSRNPNFSQQFISNPGGPKGAPAPKSLAGNSNVPSFLR